LFSGSYRPPLPLFCSILFQFHTQGLPVFVSRNWTGLGRGLSFKVNSTITPHIAKWAGHTGLVTALPVREQFTG
jgi:hypothetical protein